MARPLRDKPQDGQETNGNERFSASDRGKLDDLLREQDRMDWLRARRKRRLEAIKGWVWWITTAAVMISMGRDVARAALDLAKHLLGIGA